MTGSIDEFPCSLNLQVPFPSERLANVAYKALAVDKELSPLVNRSFAIRHLPRDKDDDDTTSPAASSTVLQVHYKATTNRMLRVAVNSFMDSLVLVIEVMEQLDSDVLAQQQPQPQPSGRPNGA